MDEERTPDDSGKGLEFGDLCTHKRSLLDNGSSYAEGHGNKFVEQYCEGCEGRGFYIEDGEKVQCTKYLPYMMAQIKKARGTE